MGSGREVRCLAGFPKCCSRIVRGVSGPRRGRQPKGPAKIDWSLQLKLQVPGDPEKFGERIFNLGSPTFTDGRIGSHKTQFTPRARKKFMSLSQDVIFNSDMVLGNILML